LVLAGTQFNLSEAWLFFAFQPCFTYSANLDSNVPDYRLKPTGKTVITFSERPAGTPEAMKAWFYPGSNYGQEFVYPKTRAVELAKAENESVPSTSYSLQASAATMKNAPVKAEKPTGEEVEVAEVYQVPPELVAQNTAPAQENTPAAPARLPRTASEMPLIALAGLFLFGAGFALRFASRKLG